MYFHCCFFTLFLDKINILTIRKATMVNIIKADLSKKSHANALISLMSEYALDPMGGNKDLPDNVKSNLAHTLNHRSDIHVILAFIDGTAVGLISCIEGFSTFYCQPLLNIHDVIVKSSHRGQGISQMLLIAAEKTAIEIGCCKLTLEVLEGNHIAQAAYLKFGFDGYELDPKMGKALFWDKKLQNPPA